MLSTASTRFARRAFATATRLTALEEFPHKEFPRAAAKTPSLKESVLSNGIKLITKDHNSTMVGLNFSFVGGSRRETEEQQGAAEYLAAGAFTGSKASSGIRTVRCLESLGASMDVRAGREHVTYSVNVMPHKAQEAVSEVLAAISSPPTDAYLLADILHDLDFRYSELESTPSMQLSEALHDAAFGEASALGSSRFAINSHKIDIDEVVSFRNAHFTAKNLVVSSSGIAHDELKRMLEGAKINTGDASPLPASPFVGGETRIRKDLDGKTHLAVAFPMPSGAEANSFAVLQNHLDSVFKASKSNTSAFAHAYTNGGVWGITVQASGAEAINAQLETAMAALKAVASGNSKAAVEAAKKAVGISRNAAMESSHNAASQIMLRAHRNGLSVDKYCNLGDVTASSVEAAAKAALGSTKVAYAAIGRTSVAPSLAAVKKMMA